MVLPSKNAAKPREKFGGFYKLKEKNIVVLPSKNAAKPRENFGVYMYSFIPIQSFFLILWGGGE